MKIQRRWPLAVFALIAVPGCLVILWRAPQQGGVEQQTTTDDAAAVPFPGMDATVRPSRIQLPGGPYEPSDPRWAKRQHLSEWDHNADWKTPFSFYGRVVDENNIPIVGAKVHLTWNNYSASGSAEADRLTDSRGDFSLLNESGKGMEVSITKDGYESAESNKSNQVAFEFADFSDIHFIDPNSTNPFVFKMLKVEDGSTGRPR